VFVLNFAAGWALKYLGKVSDEAYLVQVLSVSVLYLFVEGVLDMRSISVRTAFLSVEGGRHVERAENK